MAAVDARRLTAVDLGGFAGELTDRSSPLWATNQDPGDVESDRERWSPGRSRPRHAPTITSRRVGPRIMKNSTRW